MLAVRPGLSVLKRGLWLAAALAAFVHAQAQAPTEYEIKAGFVYNFAKFTEWPDGGRGSRDGWLVLCIMGADPFGTAFRDLEGKLIHGRTLRVKRDATLEALRDCHVLFVADSEERRVLAVLKAVEKHPVLTVSDIDGFPDAGGMIGLVAAGNRIQFDVNLTAANNANLRISSQLLRLARLVTGRKVNG